MQPPPDSKQKPRTQITILSRACEPEATQPAHVDYMARAQWLRAAVLGANDGLVSDVASLMIGVGAVSEAAKAMFVSGLAGLVAGACSMAIGEFVSVYALYDIVVAQMERERIASGSEGNGKEKDGLPNPLKAAAASALAFAPGAALPLLARGFIRSWEIRIGVVCAVRSLGLLGFGAAAAVLGGPRVLIEGWMAMSITYGILNQTLWDRFQDGSVLSLALERNFIFLCSE